MKIFYTFGKNAALSYLEVVSVLRREKVTYKLIEVSKELILIDTDFEDYPKIFSGFGGVIKGGIIFAEMGLDESEDKLNGILSAENLLKKVFSPKKGKNHIGISLYECNPEKLMLVKITSKLKEIVNMLKNNLKAEGINSGYVQVKDRILSSVSVKKNDLLNKGFELVLILSKDILYFGYTKEVQDFENFSKRDYGRPYRNTQQGLLPPKLARMMLNIAVQNNDDLILDPFCGCGTVISEAVILNFHNLIGSDINRRAIEDTKRNLDWLFQNEKSLVKKSYNIRIFQNDVQKTAKNIAVNSIDAIVTEPYLGPAFHKKITYQYALQITKNLTVLYQSALYELSKVLKPNRKIVMILPHFITDNGQIGLASFLQADKYGFDENILDVRDANDKVDPQNRDKSKLFFSSFENFVRRQIIIYTKS
jgi:tRNA G10  N-methylase Trm11